MASTPVQKWRFHFENFDQILYDPGDVLSSEKMLVQCARPQNFQLNFFLIENECVKGYYEDWMIHFRVLWLGGHHIRLNLKLSIVDRRDDSVYISSGWVEVQDNSLNTFNLLTQEELNRYSERFGELCERVDFVCEVEVKTPPGTCIEDFEDKAEGRARLGDDLAKARLPLSSSHVVPFSDVTLVCQGRSFAAHKVLLAARSDVFAAMFCHEWTLEASTGLVEIADMESGTVEQMIQFLYADRLKGDDDMSFESACKLLAAAHKYNISPLAAVCEHLISKAVAVETALSALKVAHLYGSDSLKRFVVDFAKEHMAKLSQTPEWKSFVKAKDSVTKEILKSIKGKAAKVKGRKRSRF